MFKKDISPTARQKVKSSVQRNLRTKLCETYPLLAPHIDEVLPKKSQLDLIKLPDRVSLYLLDAQPLFYQHMDDAPVPHLRLVHAFPRAFPALRIDRGAIRFVLSGAALMVPGLTSAGGRVPGDGKSWEGVETGRPVEEGRELEEGEVVVVFAEGKQEACLVGPLKMGTKEMREKKKGVAVEQGHYLGDGLWKMHFD